MDDHPMNGMIEDLHISLENSLPFTTADNETFYGIQVSIFNESNHVVTPRNVLQHFMIQDEQGKDITKDMTWLTNDLFGADFLTVTKIKPLQTIEGHIYYQNTANKRAKNIVLTSKKEEVTLGLPLAEKIQPLQLKEHTVWHSQDIDAKVKSIRTWFNTIESNIQANQMNVEKKDHYTIYTLPTYKKVMLTHLNMTYHYYYMNDQLFFVYFYPNENSVQHENRFYFHNGQMIRWLMPNESIIDRTTVEIHPMLAREEANILQLEKIFVKDMKKTAND